MAGCLVGVCIGLAYYRTSTEIRLTAYEDRIIMLDRINNKFSPRKFYQMLISLNVKFPEIVCSQAIVESGFNSEIWRTNNNPFGMKLARIRATTASGVNNGHASYAHWKDAAYDYALYQNAYLLDLKTEEEYLNYLSQQYAEDTNYVSKVRTIRNSFGRYINDYDLAYASRQKH